MPLNGKYLERFVQLVIGLNQYTLHLPHIFIRKLYEYVKALKIDIGTCAYGVRSQESGVRSQESGVRSQESGDGSQLVIRG
jgi:hypothetical protein